MQTTNRVLLATTSICSTKTARRAAQRVDASCTLRPALRFVRLLTTTTKQQLRLGRQIQQYVATRGSAEGEAGSCGGAFVFERDEHYAYGQAF